MIHALQHGQNGWFIQFIDNYNSTHVCWDICMVPGNSVVLAFEVIDL